MAIHSAEAETVVKTITKKAREVRSMIKAQQISSTLTNYTVRQTEKKEQKMVLRSKKKEGKNGLMHSSQWLVSNRFCCGEE
jgi:hypothetical protein